MIVRQYMIQYGKFDGDYDNLPDVVVATSLKLAMSKITNYLNDSGFNVQVTGIKQIGRPILK